RYSFVGNTASRIFRVRGKRAEVGRPVGPGGKGLAGKGFEFEAWETSDPLGELRSLLSRYKPAAIEGLPRFYGGAVGYLGYDMVRSFEELPDKNPNDLDL